MTIPESVREALFNLKSIEDIEVARDAVLVHKWRETVCEWAVENLLDSDDDEPVTEEWLRENGFDLHSELSLWSIEIKRNLFLALTLESALVWVCVDCPIEGESIEVAENPTRG